jgi:hypothetical protein
MKNFRQPQAILSILTVLLLSMATSFAQRTPNFNRDSQRVISRPQFDQLVDTSTTLFNGHKLSEIPDSGHITIMMCLNPIFMAHDSAFKKKFIGGRYENLEKMAAQKNYVRNIVKVYPKWVPNRGMGFYFPALQMELYGKPSLYACFYVKE